MIMGLCTLPLEPIGFSRGYTTKETIPSLPESTHSQKCKGSRKYLLVSSPSLTLAGLDCVGQEQLTTVDVN